MASAGLGAPAVAQSRSGGSAARPAVIDGATAAWLCAVPCVLAVLATGYLLGAPLGRLLDRGSGAHTFLEGFANVLRPEPTEHARYLIALCLPLLLGAAVVAAPRWLPRVPRSAIAPTVVATQVALAGVVVAAIVAQYRLRFGEAYTPGAPPKAYRYFTPPTLLAALLFTVGMVGALRVEGVRRRGTALLRGESRARRVAIGVLAALITAIWMLHAVHSDAEIVNVDVGLRYHLAFTLDETFAVLNGRTPLVDFTAQYASLWPFVAAVPMAIFGKTVLAFTIVMCTITAIALLAVYGVLRRAAQSATTALLLYLPFLATSLFQIMGTSQNSLTPGSYYAYFPLRYAGAFVLAWLTARHLERRRDGFRGMWLIFTVAGLVVVNNTDFGLAALGGTLAALLWTDGPGRKRLARLAASVLAGFGSALVLVAILTVVRTGELPELWRLLDYPRLYTLGSFDFMPIPGLLGVHLLLYSTYVAAIVLATVRASRGAPGRVLTGMLAWAGVFGLGAGAYYVGRSHPLWLVGEFSAWALALMLLTLTAVRALAAPRLRRTAIAAVVTLFGCGLAVSSLAQLPLPWQQIARLQAEPVLTEAAPDPHPLAPPRDAATRRFVASLADGPSRFVVRRGAPVAILATPGHRVAEAYGIVDVTPYTGSESLPTVQRVEATLDALREAGGNTVILPVPFHAGIVQVLERRGFQIVTARGLERAMRSADHIELIWPGGKAIAKFVDTRHLHPRALRKAG